MKRVLMAALRRLGYELHELPDATDDSIFDPVMDEVFRDIYAQCHEYTLTLVRPMYALYKAVDYVVRHSVPGDLVECGVWLGGSAMLMASTLDRLGSTDRNIFLYDTFEGMTESTEKDVQFGTGRTAAEVWDTLRSEPDDKWVRGPLEDVKRNMRSTGYPTERLTFVQGKVEDTIPEVAPDEIAILRLDTDWYDSTYHELLHLFPRVSANGVIIIDDYGAWTGAKEATDRYFEESDQPMLLCPIGSTVVMGIKPPARVDRSR